MSRIKSTLKTKRVYESPSDDDGYRIYVERLWPRGISKEKAGIDLWMKDIAPSTELRKWFKHDAKKWEEFKKRYYLEIREKKDMIGEIATRLNDGSVTLLYASREPEFNAANALLAYLDKMLTQNSTP